MYIFSTTAYCDFTKKLSKQIKLKIGRVEIKKFSDGEIYARVVEKVRGQSVYVVGTIAPPSDNLLELLLLINALKTSQAKHITAIIPYFGYGRADHIVAEGESLSAKLMADLIKCAGVDRVIAVDLHSSRVEKFFRVPVINIKAQELLVIAICGGHSSGRPEDGPHNIVIVAPDNGALPLARRMAKQLHAPIAYFDKIRPRHNVARFGALYGEVKGKNILLIDDMIDTAGTIVQAAHLLKKYGAKKIIIAATHGIFSGSAIARLKNASVEQVIVTDTIPSAHKKKFSKLRIVSVVPLLGAFLTNTN